jgi:hypothetical protein
MTTLYSLLSERCQGNNNNDGDLARELRKGACSETEELYWFALALTGDQKASQAFNLVPYLVSAGAAEAVPVFL